MKIIYVTEKDPVFGGYQENFIVPTNLRISKSIFIDKCSGIVDKFIGFVYTTDFRILFEMLKALEEGEEYVLVPMYLKFNAPSVFVPRVKILTKNQVKRKICYEYRTGILFNPDDVKENDPSWYMEHDCGTWKGDPDLTPVIWDYGVMDIPELPKYYTRKMDVYEARMVTDKLFPFLCDEGE